MATAAVTAATQEAMRAMRASSSENAHSISPKPMTREEKAAFRAQTEAKIRKEWSIEQRMALRAQQNDKIMEEWAAERARKEAQRARAIRDHELGARFTDRRFETFDPSVSESIEEAYELCKEYAAGAVKAFQTTGSFRGRRNSILLTGKCGTGKTHLSAAIANVFFDIGKEVCMDTFSGHLRALQKEFGTGEQKYFDRMVSVPLLVIDDVTELSDSKWAQQVFLEAINSRYEDLLPVIVTSNMEEADIAKIAGGRLYDRLCEMAVCLRVEGPSYRMK